MAVWETKREPSRRRNPSCLDARSTYRATLISLFEQNRRWIEKNQAVIEFRRGAANERASSWLRGKFAHEGTRIPGTLVANALAN